MQAAREHYEETGRVWLVSANTEVAGWVWYASQIGQKHRISTTHGYFTCSRLKMDDECFGKKSFRIRLTTLSRAPRAFEVQNFLSSEEVDYLVSLKMETISRDESKVMTEIYARAGDLMRTKNLEAADMEVLTLSRKEKVAPRLSFHVEDC